MKTFLEMMQQFHIDIMIRTFLLVVLGFFVAKFLSTSIDKALKKRLRPHQSMLVRRLTFYTVFFLFIASAIQQLGFEITALLGATGILTVAIGIASQTSMSNIISGIFLIGEKPFEIGDTIKINETIGEVIAIDFLSVKIRTSENTMIRIPNEVLIKSAITNISYFPIRRVDITLGVAYKTNFDKIEQILFDIAKNNKLCLDEPKPSLTILNFADTVINIQFSVWARQENYHALKNSFQNEIKNAFTTENITTFFTPQSFCIYSESTPFPIKIISNEKQMQGASFNGTE